MGRKHGARKTPGCYKVKGVSFTDWDGENDRPTRTRLKREDATLLSEALDDSLEPNNLPGAFGPGVKRLRKNRDDLGTKELRWWYRFRQKYPEYMRPCSSAEISTFGREE